MAEPTEPIATPPAPAPAAEPPSPILGVDEPVAPAAPATPPAEPATPPSIPGGESADPVHELTEAQYLDLQGKASAWDAVEADPQLSQMLNDHLVNRRGETPPVAAPR